jgi:hypothetical protein
MRFKHRQYVVHRTQADHEMYDRHVDTAAKQRAQHIDTQGVKNGVNTTQYNQEQRDEMNNLHKLTSLLYVDIIIHSFNVT